MTLENIKLDINFVRSQFPAFNDPICKDWSFFENAGGSYVPINVIKKLNDFMTSTKVQPYALYPMSKNAGEKMDLSTKLFAEMINAKENEIIIGGSTSVNLYVLSNALKHFIKPGDEIIVTNQDHEANISPWRRLSQSGAIIREWKFNIENYELDISELKNILSKKTKIVAVTHCSNIIGSINNLKEIADLVHSYGGLLIGDGVSFAPHGFPDVKKLDVDFYSFSLYKTYGPHLALLYGKEEILKKLPNQNHEFLNGKYPYTINPGGPNHEELASLHGIYEYFNLLHDHHFRNSDMNIRKKIEKINTLIASHEEYIANIFLDYISTRNDIKVLGKDKITNRNRAPTISLITNNKTSEEFSNHLISKNIATRNDNFYAWRCLESLGIETNDGVVRISMLHYNTEEEVLNLIKAIDSF